MHRFAAFAAIAALLALPATADAAPKKKPRMVAPHSAEVAAKPKPTRPYGGPWNQPRQSNQGWPTSVNDGSFSYGGRDMR